MELKKKIEALKVFIGNSPLIPVIRELYKKVLNIEAKIPKPVDLTPLRADIQRLNVQTADHFKTVEMVSL